MPQQNIIVGKEVVIIEKQAANIFIKPLKIELFYAS